MKLFVFIVVMHKELTQVKVKGVFTCSNASANGPFVLKSFIDNREKNQSQKFHNFLMTSQNPPYFLFAFECFCRMFKLKYFFSEGIFC